MSSMRSRGALGDQVLQRSACGRKSTGSKWQPTPLPTACGFSCRRNQRSNNATQTRSHQIWAVLSSFKLGQGRGDQLTCTSRADGVLVRDDWGRVGIPVQFGHDNLIWVDVTMAGYTIPAVVDSGASCAFLDRHAYAALCKHSPSIDALGLRKSRVSFVKSSNKG